MFKGTNGELPVGILKGETGNQESLSWEDIQRHPSHPWAEFPGRPVASIVGEGPGHTLKSRNPCLSLPSFLGPLILQLEFKPITQVVFPGSKSQNTGLEVLVLGSLMLFLLPQGRKVLLIRISKGPESLGLEKSCPTQMAQAYPNCHLS